MEQACLYSMSSVTKIIYRTRIEHLWT
ncbi:hypothetical protein ID866_12151 [Astraeus odoratus]|nr:hypothetical protein ID866_12151 [Astraeus odoratus]